MSGAPVKCIMSQRIFSLSNSLTDTDNGKENKFNCNRLKIFGVINSFVSESLDYHKELAIIPFYSKSCVF